MKRSVLRQIQRQEKEVQSGAGIGKDCAILAFSEEGRMGVCMQEAAVVLSGARGAAAVSGPDPESACGGCAPFTTMGELIQKCANNLGAGGFRPFAAMVTLLMPEGTEEADVRGLMEEAEGKCRELSMSIAGGQTRVTACVNRPAAAVTGFGRAWADGPGETGGQGEGFVRAAPGQDVVLSKWVGLQGTAVLAERNREKLLERYPAYLAEQAAGFGRYLSVLPEAEAAALFGVRTMHDASEGGILGALWELAEGSGVGLRIDMRRIPLRQETVEVCECCNVNPYELLSGGCLIMTTESGAGLVSALEREQIPAVTIGKITSGRDRILVNGDEVRYLDRPRRDSVFG